MLWASLWWQTKIQPQRVWSDTGRRKDEGKRTLLTRKVLAPLSSWEEGYCTSSFLSGSGSGHFSPITSGTVVQSTNQTWFPPLTQHNKLEWETLFAWRRGQQAVSQLHSTELWAVSADVERKEMQACAWGYFWDDIFQICCLLFNSCNIFTPIIVIIDSNHFLSP